MTIPMGITFGSKVVVVPGYSEDFVHSANIESLMFRQNYRWVQRGEPIGEFRINGSLGDGFFAKLSSTKLYTATIRSPVSGLLLHTELSSHFRRDLDTWNTRKEPPSAVMALLLPDDEPKPEPGTYIYSDMCRLARDMGHYYAKRSRYWSYGAMFSPKELDEICDMQMALQPRIFNALPVWSEYLDEARTLKPELRPYLKHLA